MTKTAIIAIRIDATRETMEFTSKEQAVKALQEHGAYTRARARELAAYAAEGSIRFENGLAIASPAYFAGPMMGSDPLFVPSAPAAPIQAQDANEGAAREPGARAARRRPGVVPSSLFSRMMARV